MTTEQMRFDGRVAVVTGAGNGIGRGYALALAARGAAVVINDLGGDLSGTGASARPAQAVADEITAAGGRAVPNFDDITAPGAGERIVTTALDAFGRIDVLVNNAGVLDNTEFLSSSDDVIRRVVDTHLVGTMAVTRAALKPLLEQEYGRIVNTSSGAVFGSPAGLAYQSAKSGVIAFTRAVAQIGAGHGVSANAVLPTAFTRMTNTIPDGPFHDFMASRFTPERVAAAVLVLAHESFPYSGECFLAGGGRMARLFLGVTEGYVADDPAPEDFRDQLKNIMATDGFTVPANRIEEFESYLPRLGFGTDLGALVGELPRDEPDDRVHRDLPRVRLVTHVHLDHAARVVRVDDRRPGERRSLADGVTEPHHRLSDLPAAGGAAGRRADRQRRGDAAVHDAERVGGQRSLRRLHFSVAVKRPEHDLPGQPAARRGTLRAPVPYPDRHHRNVDRLFEGNACVVDRAGRHDAAGVTLVHNGDFG